MSDEILSQVREIMARYPEPESGNPILDADIVRALRVDDGVVKFVLEFKSAQDAEDFEPLRIALGEEIEALDGVTGVQALATAEAAKPAKAPPSLGSHPKQSRDMSAISKIKRIFAIGSGKGGVGKSTVTSNLAVALAAEGKKVGLLDADLYGPSQPLMMGVNEKPQTKNGLIEPIVAHGVKTMSLGFMLPKDEAVIWRGPMLMGALEQLLAEVNWGELDVLFVDLPPGTGDIQLSLTQKANVNGGIIVTTPQDVALLDTNRAITMFEKLKTPVLGIIENMSVHICENCGHVEHIFGENGALREAEARKVPLLGQLPLSRQICVAGDSGTPIVKAAPQSVEAETYRAIAKRMMEGGLV